jgi:diacylglycerol kinase (ATP)
MMKPLLHLRKAFGYSMKGLCETFRNEMAFRIELTAAVILIPTALILSVSPIVRIMLVGSVFLVLIVELLNTGIETVVNRISAEQHYLSGMAKDAGSAAVFVASLNLVFVWGTVLFDLILNNY